MDAAAAVKERPLLFSGPMVRALLAGTKGQTRRTMNPQPQFAQVYDWRGKNLYDSEARTWCWRDYVHPDSWAEPTAALAHRCPYGTPGERLWVRETWMHLAHATELGSGSPIGYRADLDACGQIPVAGVLRSTHHYPWRPSIHMPRWACRIVLEITDVRVERLQAISEADAKAEGISPLFTDAERASRPEFATATGWANYLWHSHVGRSITAAQSAAWAHQFSGYDKAADSYSSLWESINGAGSWAANPYVWALTFRRVTP